MTTPETLGNPTVHLIRSGKTEPSVDFQRTLDALRTSGVHLRVHNVLVPGETAAIAERCARSGAERVVAVGGDGTVNQVVAGVRAGAPHGSCAVGIVPLGTGNDFARHLGISEDIPTALHDAATGMPVPTDLGQLGDRTFVNSATIGWGAQVSTETPEPAKNVLGRFAYVAEGIRQWGDFKPVQARIISPELLWEGELVGLAITNGSTTGGGMPVAPDAAADDGLLDLLIVPKTATDVLPDIAMMALIQGRPQRHPTLEYRQVPWAEVTLPTPTLVTFDGEPEQVDETPLRFEVLPRAIPIIHPNEKET